MNPFAPELRDDPYPYYARLRRDSPVFYEPRQNFYALTRYADVVAAARDHATFSSAQGVGLARSPGGTVLTTDPPQHERLRRLLSSAFTPGSIQLHAPVLETIAGELIEKIQTRHRFDLIADLAQPYPIRAIAHLLGVDAARWPDIQRWADALADHLADPRSAGPLVRYQRTFAEFTRYMLPLLAERRRNPGSDLLSQLIQAHQERDALTGPEILYFCELLLSAGTETTTSIIANAAVLLIRMPELAARLAAEPALISGFIEEVARFDGPVQAFFRTTTREVELHGVRIPANSKVALVWGSANRDPDVFADPDRFDPERSPNPHLAFGTGIHYCMGAPLARLELGVLARVLLREFRPLKLDAEQPAMRRENPLLRGWSRLPLRFLP